jgi:AAA domain
MSMNKTNTVEAHVSSTPLVICVGPRNRRWEFEENGFLAFAYTQLRSKSTAAGPNYGDPLSPVHTNDYESFYLDDRLYKLGLEGRRVVILAPPYTGPRKGNPADRVAELLREEGARVSIVPDQCVLLNEYGKFDEDAEYFEHNEPAMLEAMKAATQTFGGFKRKQSSGSKPEALLDGVLFRAENHIIFGSAGQGKTMLACYISAELIKRGESVVYLDHENGAGRIFKRMHALGCTEEMLEELFYYFEDPASTLEDAPDYREMLAEIRPSLVVFDSLFGFMVVANLDENYGPDVGKWFDAFAPPTLEAATLILDHTPKKGDTERGSGRKRDAVDVSWEVKGNFSTDRVGPLKLSLKKSRNGGLGEVVSFTFGGTPLRAQRDDVRKLQPHERTLEVLEDGMTAGEWLDASGASETTFFRHRDKLMAEGLVEKIGDRYSHVGVEES